MTIDERIEQLKRMDAAYHADNQIVSDAAYDKFRDETRRLAPDHPYFRTVGSPPRSAWPKRRLGFPMGSLDKVQTPDEMKAWLPSGRIFLSEKLDGISVLMRWEDGRLAWAATRGDGEVGEDITDNVRRMRGLPMSCASFTGFVRGEIILRKSTFETHFKSDGYKNCRNAAGGAAKDLVGGRCHHLTVMCYELRPDEEPCSSKESEFEILQGLCFSVPRFQTFVSADAIFAHYGRYVDGDRAELDYDIDGLVLCVNDTGRRESMGLKDNRPAGAVAFKFPHDSAETILRDVVWQTGASGRITPVAIFDPVELAGATVERASLHNVANIWKLGEATAGFRLGDTILCSRRNDVIPFVESVVSANSDGLNMWSPPGACPACGTPTRMDGEYLVCPNRVDCEAQVAGSLKRWISKIGVKDFGGALIETLCEAGLAAEPADLYRVGIAQLAALSVGGRRFGNSAARTALDNLHARKSLPLHVLVGSLGIPMWSRSMCKLLVEHGYTTIANLKTLDVEALVKIPGVEETKARAFVLGFAEALPKIENLLAAGVSIAPEASGVLKGATVCMTGFRDAAMEAAIEAQGGTVKSSAGKGLAYLVAKDPSGASGKLEAARKNGTRVTGVEEMWTMLGGRR